MDNKYLKEIFRKINVWKRGDQRAPHKPLLVLFALAQVMAGRKDKIAYQEVDKALRPLLAQFGPPRKSYHPEQPFWWLQTDGIWELDIDPATFSHRKGGNNPTKGQLLKQNVHGGFTQNILQILQTNHSLLFEIASEILEKHFPESMHDEILEMVGLDLSNAVVKKSVRDPAFRENVLRAYEYRCAVCSFDIRISYKGKPAIAIEVKYAKRGLTGAISSTIGQCLIYKLKYPYVAGFLVYRGPTNPKLNEYDAPFHGMIKRLGFPLVIRR